MSDLIPNPVDEAWRLVQSGGPVDDARLFRAVTQEAALTTQDARTRLLVRDALQGLRDLWTAPTFNARLRHSTQRQRIESFLAEPPADDGFPTLRERLMTPTDPQTALQMFRELGRTIDVDSSLVVGGSLALMFDAILVRHTEDIDIVDELPESLRREHELLASLSQRYGLKLTHFQSHYLPDGWAGRTGSLGRFGRLDVHVVDPIDVLTGKLFSRRTKDLDDVRLALPKIDGNEFRHRIATSTAAFRRDATLLEAATRNWYIVTGEEALPGPADSARA
jgi:hypothetical protein